MPLTLPQLNARIERCTKCPRLVAHCRLVAREKRAAYHDHNYHGKPVPNFGAPAARMLIVGLAPGAHGANRTGRMFTGDRSGDFLYRALHETGFANQATSVADGDGLQLTDALITGAAHCAPPGNKPSPVELENCAPFLSDTFDLLLPKLRVVVCLGKLALDATLRLYQSRGWIEKLSPYRFGHGAAFSFAPVSAKRGKIEPPRILCSYHPSQQNTFTGRLTRQMLRALFDRARQTLSTDDHHVY